MSDEKHSPGPWSVRQSCRDGSGYYETAHTVIDPAGMPVVTVNAMGNDLQDADARLIAAAPDMLALLREIWQTPCECPLGGNGPDIPKAVGRLLARIDGTTT